MRTTILAALGLATACTPSPERSPPPSASAAAAAAILDSALGVMAEGGRSGPVSVFASGTLDKAAEGQGYRPGESAPGPFREILVLGQAGAGVGWEYREDRYDGTYEWFRESYPSDTTRLYVVPALNIALPARAASFDTDRRRLFRRFPHLFVEEVRGALPNVRFDGWRSGRAVVTGALEEGALVTLTFDSTSYVLRDVAYLTNVPGRGDVEVRWWYDDYRRVDGLGLFPFRYSATVGGGSYLELVVDSIGTTDADVFVPPPGARTLAERTVEVDTPASQSPLTFEEVAADVFTVPEVRSGFAPLVVEFPTFLLVVDAPASFPLFGQLPAGETDPGPTMSWASERFVDAIHGRFPEKPIRYLVLTHFHEDHGGGARAFVAEGATVLGSTTTRAPVERLVGLPAHTVRDRLARSPRALAFEAVDSVRVIAEGARRVELLPIAGNPHYDGMLAVHLPDQGLMYVSDLVTPEPLEIYPRGSHAALDRFFVQWLVEHDLAPRRVVAMHGSGELTPEHLARARADRDG